MCKPVVCARSVPAVDLGLVTCAWGGRRRVSVFCISMQQMLYPHLYLSTSINATDRASTSTSTDAPALLYLALIAALLFILTIAIVVQVLHVMVECKCINPESLPHILSPL